MAIRDAHLLVNHIIRKIHSNPEDTKTYYEIGRLCAVLDSLGKTNVANKLERSVAIMHSKGQNATVLLSQIQDILQEL